MNVLDFLYILKLEGKIKKMFWIAVPRKLSSRVVLEEEIALRIACYRFVCDAAISFQY